MARKVKSTPRRKSKSRKARKSRKQRGGGIQDVAPGYKGTVVAKPAWDDLTSRIGDPDEIPTLMSV
jgi:hypothetical protein